jgi:maleamate amidohydrolase
MSTLPAGSVGLGQRCALLVIDATLGFTSPNSKLGCPADAALVEIAKLLAVFRAKNLPIYFSSNAYAAPHEASVFREKLPVLEELVAGGMWADIDPRVAPLPHEKVLRKTVPSAFFDTPLRNWLQADGVDAAVVCGFSTSGCVRASAVDAMQCNLRVTVAADACADRDEPAHHHNLRDLGLKVGDVRSTADIVAEFQGFLPDCSGGC